MGWNASNRGTGKRSHNASAGRNARRGLLVWTLLTLLLAAALGTTFLYFRRSPSNPEKVKQPLATRRINEVPTNSAARLQPTKTGDTKKVAAAKTNDVWLGVEVDHRKAETNGTLIVETIYTKDGKSHIYYHDMRPKVFEHASDQILALATADAPGGTPPLPSVPNFEAEFLRSLKTKIVINDDDAPEVKAMKERVKAARHEILELMEDGMSADEVLKMATQQREDDAAVRMEAVRLVKQMLDEGDREGAEALCAKYNEALEKMGIMKIQLPVARERKESSR